MTLKQAFSRQRGMTMIEVLISIVVFAFGLLGIAGLLVVAIRGGYSAQQRSLATQLAYDITDRTRANLVGFNGGNYDKPALSAYTTQVTNCTNATSAAPGCTTAEMAQNDLYEWQNLIKSTLGGTAAGIICKDSSAASGTWTGSALTADCDGSGTAYAIKIYWADERGQSQGSTQTYQSFVTRYIP